MFGTRRVDNVARASIGDQRIPGVVEVPERRNTNQQFEDQNGIYVNKPVPMPSTTSLATTKSSEVVNLAVFRQDLQNLAQGILLSLEDIDEVSLSSPPTSVEVQAACETLAWEYAQSGGYELLGQRFNAREIFDIMDAARERLRNPRAVNHMRVLFSSLAQNDLSSINVESFLESLSVPPAPPVGVHYLFAGVPPTSLCTLISGSTAPEATVRAPAPPLPLVPPVNEKWIALQKKHPCVVCSDVLAAPQILPCSHSFCGACVSDVKRQCVLILSLDSKHVFRTCPTCRAEFEPTSPRYERHLDDVICELVSAIPPCTEKVDWTTRRAKYTRSTRQIKNTAKPGKFYTNVVSSYLKPVLVNLAAWVMALSIVLLVGKMRYPR